MSIGRFRGSRDWAGRVPDDRAGRVPNGRAGRSRGSAARAGRGVRVTLVSRIFLPEPSAASFRLAALVRALADDGARVDVLTTAPGPGVERGDGAPSPGLPARVRRAPVLRDGSGYVRGYLPYLSFDVPLAWRLLRTRRPDVVVVEPPPTTGAVVRAVCALRRIPYVYYAADVWSDASASTGAPAVVVRVVRAMERFALRGAAAVLSVNDGVTDRVRELGAGEVVTVGNGVDTGIFHRGAPATPDSPHPAPDSPHPAPDSPHPAPADDRLSTETASEGRRFGTPMSIGYSDDRAAGIPAVPFLLYAGTASEWQGAEIFARAMARVLAELPDAKLVYLGQGSSWPALRALAADLPTGAIELHDPVDAATSAIWQRAARAAVVSLKPGIGYDFAMPTKMFAALACGTPVTFAGVGPAADLIAEKSLGRATGYDAGEVAEAMIAALRTRPTDDDRDRLAAWVAEHRSLAAVGHRSAAAITAAARTG
ncbi:glycosyltransferase [Ruania zhangjianzhongii]|uniref:glycosyltransferase n=1 Tax=Ruania zhangjianzhongii TaxID=2603206 RepID=UPI0011CB510B|nr:glycosyltransferase [Ruania zhangjianzhongii]